MGNQGERVVGVAVDLGDDPVLDLGADPASGVALKAGGQNVMIGHGQGIRGVGSRAVQDSAAGFGVGGRLCGAGGEPSAEHRSSGKQYVTPRDSGGVGGSHWTSFDVVG